MTQFVYVLEDKNTHLLKIGISVDPEFRAKQVGKDFGADTVVAGVLKVDDARRTEQFLHGMLSERRVVGEWFELAAKQKDYLLAYFSDKPMAERRSAARRSRTDDVRGSVVSPGERDGTGFEQVREAVRQTMKAHELTQVELAQRLGMTQPALAKMLTGRTGQIPESWQKVLDELGLKLVAVPQD